MGYDEQFARATNLRGQEAVDAFKRILCLPELTGAQRTTIHFNIAQFLSNASLQSPDVTLNLSKEVLDEVATSFYFAKHLWNYGFIPDAGQKEKLRWIRDACGERADRIVFQLGGTAKNFRGYFGTRTSLVEDFRRFSGYPQQYYEEVQSQPSQSSAPASTASTSAGAKTASGGGWLLPAIVIAVGGLLALLLLR